MEVSRTHPKIKAADSVRETVNEDGAVLLDIRQGTCFSMNRIGSRIWQMLKRGNSLTDIANALEVEFEVPRFQIEADVAAFVGELRKRNLIEAEVPDKKRSWLSSILKVLCARGIGKCSNTPTP